MFRLFKNSFFSFLKSKVATVLLVIVIFVASATFTMMQSTSYSFHQSYNQVMQNTALHDFTINEKYSIIGKPGIAVDKINPKAAEKKYLDKNDVEKTKNIYEVTLKIDKAEKTYKDYYATTNIKKLISDWSKNNKIYVDTTNIDKAIQSKAVASGIHKLQSFIENKIHIWQSRASVQKIKELYGNKISLRKVESLSVSTLQKQFKVVNVINGHNNIDKIHMFSGNNVDEVAKEEKMKAQAKLVAIPFFGKTQKETKVFDESKSDIIYDSSKGFKYTIRDDKSIIPHIVTYYDLSSFQAVVSPSYAQKHNISPIDKGYIRDLLGQKSKGKIKDREVYAPYIVGSTSTNLNPAFTNNKRKFIEDHNLSKNVIWVGSIPFFVTGIGVSPDFAFPIIDAHNPLPNVYNQAIVFTNTHGYKRVKDSFRTNPQENFLVGRFNSNFVGNKQAAIKKINESLRPLMSWPSNIKIVSDKYDISEKINLSAQRITFLSKLNKTISTITYITILMLSLFTAGIVIIVIKKELSSSRQMLGILMANGYSKTQIAFSMTSVAFLFTIIPCALGYTAGHFLQYGFINLFKNYWTIPIYGNRFSFISLLITIGLPFIGIILLSIAFTYLELNKPLIKILSNAESKQGGFWSNRISKLFFWTGIKFKTTLTLITSNVFKMVLALFATFIIVVTGGVAITSFGKFKVAMNASANKVNYTYKVDLLTPTIEGGNMNAITLDKIGANGGTLDAKSTYDKIMKTPDKAYNGQPGNSYIHIPSFKDSEFLKPKTKAKLNDKDHPNYLHFLDNKVQFKSLLDIDFAGINPWDIARNKMPSNQQNIADEKMMNFIDMAHDIQANNKFLKAPFWKQDLNDNIVKGWLNKSGSYIKTLDSKGHYYIDNSKNSENLTLSNEYKEFIFNALEYAVKNYGNKDADPKVSLPYFISYRNIIVNKNDELFTSIKATYNGKSFAGGNQVKNVSITGINKDSKMVNLSKNEINKLSSANHNSSFIPVIANTYFAKTYGLKKGDTFKINITNMADRHINGSHDAVAKIMGIDTTYNGIKLYTLRKYANDALNLNKTLATKTEQQSGENKFQYFNKDKAPFNGVFTKGEDPLIFNTLGIYSETNTYVGEDTISDSIDDSMNWIINKYLKSGNFKNPNIEDMKSYFAKYGHSPLGAAFSNAEWVSMSDYAFKTILVLSNKLMWMIEAIALIISLLFVAIISMMIINDNKKFICSLKVMGYKNSEIRRIFLGSFIPSLLIGILIAVPFVGGILLAIEKLVINFGNVLVPLEMVGWEIALACIILVLSFSIIYIASMRQLKNTNMLNAFKV